MNNYQELYKLIENLKGRIKKLDCQKNNKSNTIINSYRIFYPKNKDLNKDLNKKYIGLLFDSNFDDFNTESNNNPENLISFIKLKKGNIVINYSLYIDVINTVSKSIICSLSLGIKDKVSSKIKIIKGSKYVFDLNNQSLIINNKIQFSNTILYMSNDNEELCMIAELNKKCVINYKKSLIKILYL